MASTKIFLIFLLVATPIAVAQGGLLNGLLSLIHIDGVLYCSPNGKIDVINGTTTPIFPNASVQLQCGAGNVVSSRTTNGSGVVTPLQNILSSELSSSCNSTLNTLVSIVNLGANGFELLTNLN